jgi:zinc transport system substrate-binding protein
MLMLSFTLLLACDRGAPSSEPMTGKTSTKVEQVPALTVTVSIVPQTHFVKRLGNERVSVQAMVEPGANPATYEPKPEQLKALQASAVYMRIRVPFEEAWMDRIRGANPEMRVVDTTEGIERLPVDSTHVHDEDEEEEAQETSGEHLDPHIWLSPRLVKTQAGTIAEALSEVDPDNRSFYQTNLEDFLGDIDELDAYIREKLQNLENRKFMVFHPSWGYFAHDYDLEMIPVEVGGQEPSARELAALIEEAQEESIRVVFAQPEFSVRSAETIAQEIDGEVRLISPLDPDWEENLRRVADTFAEVLGQ